MSELSAVAAIRTNLSDLFFTPDRVYKVLRPVSTPFVDFSDPQARLEATTLEYEMNRRISPDVYLGLADLSEDGAISGRMIIMRRLPPRGELNEMLRDHRDGAASDTIRDLARFVAAFHCSLEPIHDERAAVGSAETIGRNWEDNLAAIRPFAGPVIDRDDFAEVEALQAAFIAGRGVLFEERRSEGWIRDGHGDLRGEHIYHTPDGWRLIDCVAFRDDLRISDVLCDVAFLAMDLHRLLGPAAAAQLMRDWDEFTGEHHPSSLAHFYVAYRAHVRCKVECLRFAEGHQDALVSARVHHGLALEHLRLARVRLVMVGGGAGTGKSTVAEGVATRIGAVRLRSDEIRKDIAGVAHDEHAFAEPGGGIYTREMSLAVADEIARQATSLLERGVSVVADATWSSAESRGALCAIAERTVADVTEIRCDVDPAIARERIARRMASVHNPSDATPDLVDHLLARFDPWPTASTLVTNGSIREGIEKACALVGSTASSATASRRFHLAVIAAAGALG